MSMVGTITSVRASAAMPAEKSIRGSGCGVTISVASQFTIVTASWLVANRQSTTTGASSLPSRFRRQCALATRPAVATPVIAAIAPR